jgi:hypothetical protein
LSSVKIAFFMQILLSYYFLFLLSNCAYYSQVFVMVSCLLRTFCYKFGDVFKAFCYYVLLPCFP